MNGEALKNLRKKYGYTRKSLAQRIYVTESIIKSWEEGWELMAPSNGELDGMAEAFNMSEDVLREVLEQSLEDDYDESEHLSFIDFIDAGIRTFKKYKREDSE